MATSEVMLPEENSNVCEACLSENLIKQVGIRSCNKCKKPFCVHYASKIDTQYCVDCMSDVAVTVDKITVTYEHYNEATDTVTTYSRRGKKITIDGFDWLFTQRKIPALTDAELPMAIEYHQTYCRLLIAEAEQRRTEKAHRFAGVKMQTASTSTTTIVSKSTQTKSTKQAAQLSALMSAMIAKGMTMEQIKQMLGGK